MFESMPVEEQTESVILVVFVTTSLSAFSVMIAATRLSLDFFSHVFIVI